MDARRAWMQWVMRFVRDNAASRERQGSMKGASRKPQGNRLEARGDEASSLEISRARVATHAGDGPRVRQHEAEVAVSSSADCLCLTLAAPSSLRLSLSPAMNPNYEQIGKTFVQQYYAMFDGDVSLRSGLANFYSVHALTVSCSLPDSRTLTLASFRSLNHGKESFYRRLARRPKRSEGTGREVKKRQEERVHRPLMRQTFGRENSIPHSPFFLVSCDHV